MSDDRLRQIYAEGGHDFSSDSVNGLAISDLNETAIEDFRRRWIEKATKAEDKPMADRLKSKSLEQLLEDA